jgi:hypothetical protein
LVEVLARAIGETAAVTAVEIAGGFTMVNRVTHTTGLHVPVRRLEIAMPILEQLGAMEFPNSNLVADDPKKAGSKLRRIARRLGR